MNNNFLETIQSKFEKVLMPIATKLNGQRHLSAVRDAMALLIPMTIIGGISILLAQPPVNPETMKATNIFFKFLLGWYDFAQAYGNILFIPFDLTLGLLSVYVVVGVAYKLASTYKLPRIETAFSALLAFLCVAGIPQSLETGKFISTGDLGATGMFTAIVMGLAVVEITKFFIDHNITIKMPAAVPPNVASPFKILTPMAFNVILFMALNMICKNLTGAGLTNVLFAVIQPLLSATDSLPSILLLTFISQSFWFFGIHGDNMIGAIVNPITTMNITLNLEAYNAGLPMEKIFAGQFSGVWGVWTPMIALLVTMLIFAKSEHLRKISHLAPLSTAFNINEPLLFGVPTVLNVMLYIPNIICTLFNLTAAYLLTYVGLIGKTYIVLPWTTPAPIAAFLSTMDWKALALWVALFVIDIMIWAPFIKSYDKQCLKQQEELVD